MERVIRVFALILIIGLFSSLIIFNMVNKPPISDYVWDEGTTIGDAETATRHYIQYSDFACPTSASLALTAIYSRLKLGFVQIPI